MIKNNTYKKWDSKLKGIIEELSKMGISVGEEVKTLHADDRHILEISKGFIRVNGVEKNGKRATYR